jgi:hypothetical protein
VVLSLSSAAMTRFSNPVVKNHEQHKKTTNNRTPVDLISFPPIAFLMAFEAPPMCLLRGAPSQSLLPAFRSFSMQLIDKITKD